MGPAAGCLSSRWQWDTEAVSSINTRCPARHTPGGAEPSSRSQREPGQTRTRAAGPFADCGRLAAPGCVLQDTPLPTPASARPRGTGHSGRCGSLEALWDAGELVAMP